MRLNELREEIDAIDDALLELYSKRMELVEEVGRVKNSQNAPIYRPEREKEIIERLNAQNRGLLSKEAIEALFLELFAVSRNLELPEAVAFLGPEASFTHQAAQSRFGRLSRYLPIASIEGVFREVKRKSAKFGVVPIENSSNGMVSETIASLDRYGLRIIAEVIMDIHMSFASKQDDLKKIRKIYSKDIAFGQCRKFLEDMMLEEVELIPVESTAKAAKLAAQSEDAAAISPALAASMHHLPILFENIEDSDKNRTRFFVISDFDNAPSGNDKTSILAHLENRPGALVAFLNRFEEADINLTKIKSHITQGESVFFLEFNGHKDDEVVQEILKPFGEQIKILGSYVKQSDDL